MATATRYEQLSTRLIVNTMMIVLLLGILLTVGMTFVNQTPLEQLLSSVPMLLFLMLFFFIVRRKFLPHPRTKYVIVIVMFLSSLGLMFASTNATTWIPILLNLCFSLIYLNKRIVVLGASMAVFDLLLYAVLKPADSPMAATDFITATMYVLMLAAAGYAVCDMGNRMMKDAEESKAQVERLLAEVRGSVQSLRSFSVQATEQIGTADRITGEMTTGFEEVARGSESLATEMQGIDQAMGQAGEATGSAEESARTVREKSESTTAVAERVREQVSRFLEELRSVGELVSRADRQVEELAEESEKIGRMLEKIQQISRQTGILALNAGIEAARAGEHGRGFAIVATEIRKLAHETEGATESMTELLEGIRERTKVVAGYSQEQVDSVARAADSAGGVAQGLSDIVENALATVAQAEEMDRMMKRLSEATGDVAERVVSVSGVTEETNAAMEQLAASLTEQRERMSAVSGQIADLQSRIDTLAKLTEQESGAAERA